MNDAWREITTEWQGETAFIGRNSNGGSVQMGKIGEQPGVSPMELLLMGLAGCTGMDVASILQKKRQKLTALKVRARGKKAEDYPTRFTEFEVEYLLWGEDLDPKAVEDAIRLSEEKYCSVGATLKFAGPVRSSYRVMQPAEAV
jgi:putative redox protein